MNVIFLDIDGVMATGKEFYLSKTAKSYIEEYDCYPFNKGCVGVLNEIIDETDAEIIISSDWKLFYEFEDLKDIFKINGVVKEPINTTYNLHEQFPYKPYDQLRVTEINQTLYYYYHDINNWVVIDDINMSKAFGENFILCSRILEGIKQSHLKKKIINVLKK